MVQHANNAKIAKNMTDAFPHPYTEEHGRRFINYASSDDPVHIFAIERAGIVCGGIGIHPQQDIMRKNAELGYWLAEPFWGQGIIQLAIPQIVSWAFETYDIVRIFARPFGSNIASQKVLEKCGFKLEAVIPKSIYKNGTYEDEFIYAIRSASSELIP